MYANLQGDYVKGKDYTAYPEKVQEGIRLHRTIDHYIDTHPVVLELLHRLYPSLPKISGIAVDLYFDHLLAREWKHFSKTPLNEFVNQFYTHQPSFSESFSPEFQFMLDKMKEFDWLNNYQYLEGLRRSSTGLSRRISFENNLNEATEVFLKQQAFIEQAFHNFMQEAIPFFENYFMKN